LFNAKTEATYTHDLSPAGTEWAYGTTANFETLSYKDWETWTGGAGGGPPSTVGKDAVLHLIKENIYIDIKFSSWGGTGGQLTYTRSTAPLTAIQSWRLQYFGTAASAGDAADDFDFDHDGLVNLVEFAFGLNPKEGSSLMLPQPTLVEGGFGATFTQANGVSGVTYRAEWSPDLAPGSWTPVADTGSGTVHTFNVSTVNHPSGFMRFIVTMP
jgi:hypothetical protein